MTKQEIREELSRRLNDPNFVLQASTEAMRAVLIGHKLAGNPIASWNDGKVVIVQPEDIVRLLEEGAEAQSRPAAAE